MKSVSLRCVCGASIDLRDDAESDINEDGSPDEEGRRFLIQVQADQWLDRHQPCIEARIKAAIMGKVVAKNGNGKKKEQS